MPRSRRAVSTSTAEPRPPNGTSAERHYLSKQIAADAVVIVTLRDGETIRGTVCWQDQMAVGLLVHVGRELLIPKSAIAAISKADSEGGSLHSEKPT